MKITVVASACDRSEVAQYRELARRGHHIHVFYDPSWEPSGAFDNSSITSAPLAVRHRLDRGAAHHLRASFEQDAPDLLYAPYNKTLAISLVATRGLPTRIVGYRGTIGHLSRWDPASWITYFHPRLCGIVCNSHGVERYLTGLRMPAQLRTIYKGFSTDWYTSQPPASLESFGLPDDAFVVGFTGNVRPVKGIDVLLKALVQLPEESRIQVLLVGEIRCKRIRRMLEEPEFSARVHVTGFRQDAPRLTGACNAFVMPSIERESFCRAVVEAMCQQVPPIVTHVGGMPEMVEHGVSGLVVPPSNPGALAAAMLQMERDAAGCAAMGKAARERIANTFDVQRACDGLESFFQDLANR